MSHKIINEEKLKDLEIFKSWCKENGFIFPSSEIYGGFAAVYDYGHYGTLLKNNIQRMWEKSMVQKRSDIYLLDSGIFMHPKTWVASGHAEGFADVLVEDKVTHKRYRADHLIEEWFETHLNQKIDMDKKTPEEMAEIIKQYNITSPDGNELTSPRNFGLMVKTNMGTTDSTLTDQNVVYARAETCQGIYLQYKNLKDSVRAKLPFGIAQVGKAFRNEIVARQFVFRTREFEQMEMQYFHHPKDKDKLFDMWMQERMNWYIDLGISKENLRFKQHEKLVFYASKAFDIEYKFDTLGGFKEIEGIHDRGDYDLSQHSKYSGVSLDYFDPATNERFVPHIIETSVGLNRLVMMVLEESLRKQSIVNSKGEEDERFVLKLNKKIAPVKFAILPLQKKNELIEIAKQIQHDLSDLYQTEYDDVGSIGKRYRRQDEIGTPYCITIDFDSIEKNTVTIRDRDSMEQVIVEIAKLNNYCQELIK